MRVSSYIKTSIALGLLAVVFTACGGSNNSEDTEQEEAPTSNNVTPTAIPTPNNVTPTAKANVAYTTIAEGEPLHFNSTGSEDSDGAIVGYLWKDGSKVIARVPSFDKGDFSVGMHEVTLTVIDDDGATATDSVTVTVTGAALMFTSRSGAIVPENQKKAITLRTTSAYDVTFYSIFGTDSKSFSINSKTGEVTFNEPPDHETKKSYTFTAFARDASGSTAEQVVHIVISNIIE